MSEFEVSSRQTWEHPAIELGKNNIPVHKAVLVGNTALSVYGISRPASSIEAVVSPKMYQELRQQTAVVEDEGETRFHLGNVEISTQWNGQTLPGLSTHAALSKGVPVAQLEHLVRGLNKRDLPQDRAAITAVSDFLATQRVDAAFMTRDTETVQEMLPEHLHDDPAVLLAAHGLYAARSKFGSGHDSVNYYSGSLEVDPTPAAWRTALHTLTVMSDGQRWAAQQQLDDATRLTIISAAAHHDHKQGGGRGLEADRDEGGSALTFEHLARLYGIDDRDFIAGGKAGIRATLFDETARQQRLDPAAGYMEVQRGVGGPDLSVCDRADGPVQAFGPMIENGCRKETAFWHDQVLAKNLRAYNRQMPPEQQVVPASVRAWLRFIERRGSSAAKEYAQQFLTNNREFVLNHTYPEGYEPGHGYRESNARFWQCDKVARALAKGELERCYDFSIAYAHDPEGFLRSPATP